jgi:SSS family solute:Na+ symporter
MSVKTDIDFFLSGRSLPAWITGWPSSRRISARWRPRHGRQRRSIRRGHRALLLDRRGAGDGLPRHRDDARYYGAGSAPCEYLRLRFNGRHALNAMTFAVATVLIAGSTSSRSRSSCTCCSGGRSRRRSSSPRPSSWPTSLGGLTSAIYNEVLQFFIIVASLLR